MWSRDSITTWDDERLPDPCRAFVSQRWLHNSVQGWTVHWLAGASGWLSSHLATWQQGWLVWEAWRHLCSAYHKKCEGNHFDIWWVPVGLSGNEEWKTRTGQHLGHGTFSGTHALADKCIGYILGCWHCGWNSFVPATLPCSNKSLHKLSLYLNYFVRIKFEHVNCTVSTIYTPLTGIRYLCHHHVDCW